jgi:hypothetical protein
MFLQRFEEHLVVVGLLGRRLERGIEDFLLDRGVRFELGLDLLQQLGPGLLRTGGGVGEFRQHGADRLVVLLEERNGVHRGSPWGSPETAQCADKGT